MSIKDWKLYNESEQERFNEECEQENPDTSDFDYESLEDLI